MNGPKIVITKSTVPAGTAERVRTEIAGQTKRPFHVCANPEFLKEGAAIASTNSLAISSANASSTS